MLSYVVEYKINFPNRLRSILVRCASDLSLYCIMKYLKYVITKLCREILTFLWFLIETELLEDPPSDTLSIFYLYLLKLNLKTPISFRNQN